MLAPDWADNTERAYEHVKMTSHVRVRGQTRALFPTVGPACQRCSSCVPADTSDLQTILLALGTGSGVVFAGPENPAGLLVPLCSESHKLQPSEWSQTWREEPGKGDILARAKQHAMMAFPAKPRGIISIISNINTRKIMAHALTPQYSVPPPNPPKTPSRHRQASAPPPPQCRSAQPWRPRQP